MKSQDVKQEFVQLRAAGKSYRAIAKELHIAQSTCCTWEKELGAEIAQLKQDELNALYDTYGMKKAASIKRLGETLAQVEAAIDKADLSKVPPEKLLELKLRYLDALQKEYVSTEPAYRMKKHAAARDVIDALSDLLNRIRAGEVTTEQASRESMVLSNMLKAYEQTELQAKIDALEAVIEERK